MNASSHRIERPRVREVAWFPDHGSATPYLLSVVLWVPLTALPLILLAEVGQAAGLIGLVGVLLVHFAPHEMYLSACNTYDISPVGWWALKAQVWLLCGGAVRQALRAQKQ